MRLDLLNGAGPAIALVIGVALGLAALVSPMVRRYPDDQGDGMTLVLLPKPKNPAWWRAPTAILIFLAAYAVQRGAQGDWSLDHIYSNLVARAAGHVVRAPGEITSNLNNFVLGWRFLIAAAMVTVAIMGRGGLARRLMVAFQAVIYLGVMLLIDTVLVVVEVVTGLGVGPATLFGNLVAVAVGFLGMARMLYANYALPRPTALPFVKRPRSGDAAVLLVATFGGAAICLTGVFFLYHLASANYRPALAVLLPVPFAEGTLVIRMILLAVISFVSREPEPAVGDERPPIDIIIPAYNEEEVIVGTLEAIDVAAGRYGGPVNVILVNDGSTDATRELASSCIAAFRHARGNVYDGRHGGKSEALNAALSHATSDIVVRIDADTVIGEWSFVYAPRWFRNPEIGLVEAMMFPRYRVPSPFPRMRLFENLKLFGLTHYLMQSVDGVNVVPGVYTVFRREVAVAMGGFTVGMNGEDGDFTLRFSRMGYRVAMDPKIVVYEDVPATFPEIREQRIRWYRAIHHNQSRNGPYRAGVATPKVWFSQTHQFFIVAFSPARLMLPFYLLMTAAFEGTYRMVILVFIGGWLLAKMTFMALESVMAAGYGQLRHLGWVLLWPLWQECLLLFSTEEWLSLPGRPLGLHGTRPVPIAEYVIH